MITRTFGESAFFHDVFRSKVQQQVIPKDQPQAITRHRILDLRLTAMGSGYRTISCCTGPAWGSIARHVHRALCRVGTGAWLFKTGLLSITFLPF